MAKILENKGFKDYRKESTHKLKNRKYAQITKHKVNRYKRTQSNTDTKEHNDYRTQITQILQNIKSTQRYQNTRYTGRQNIKFTEVTKSQWNYRTQSTLDCSTITL